MTIAKDRNTGSGHCDDGDGLVREGGAKAPEFRLEEWFDSDKLAALPDAARKAIEKASSCLAKGDLKAAQDVFAQYVEDSKAAQDDLTKKDSCAVINALQAEIFWGQGRTKDASKVLQTLHLTEKWDGFSAEGRRHFLKMLRESWTNAYDAKLKFPTVIQRAYIGRAGEEEETLFEKAAREKDRLERFIPRGRNIPRVAHSLMFLKTYSSFSPLLRTHEDACLGGGYFLKYNDYGCVIDPGHHFLHQFLMARHSIDDIDCIIVTHFHDDHYADLPALLSLLHKYRLADGDAQPSREVTLLLDETTNRAFEPVFKNSGYKKKNSTVLKAKSAKPIPLTSGLSVKALPSDHEVLPRKVESQKGKAKRKKSTAVGLDFSLRIGSRREHQHLVITGDTPWNEKLAEVYRKLSRPRPFLVAHLGGICDTEPLSLTNRNAEGRHPNHLCIRGVCEAIEACNPSMVILSEIGEEMKGVVFSLAEMIAETYNIKCHVGIDGIEIPLA